MLDAGVELRCWGCEQRGGLHERSKQRGRERECCGAGVRCCGSELGGAGGTSAERRGDGGGKRVRGERVGERQRSCVQGWEGRWGELSTRVGTACCCDGRDAAGELDAGVEFQCWHIG